MATHRKAAARIQRKRRRKKKMECLKAKGLTLDDFFSGGFYIGKREKE